MDNKKEPGLFVPDTVAYGLFCIFSGLGSFLVEKFVLNFTWMQWVSIHLIYSLRFPLSFLCGRLDDFLKRYFPQKAAAVALCFYGSAFYISGAIVAGALFGKLDWKNVLAALMVQTLSNIVFAPWYENLRRWTRQKYICFRKWVVQIE